MSTTTTTAPATHADGVRFGRLERRGLLLGLSAAQVGVLGVALVVAVAAVYTAGTPGLVGHGPGVGAAAGRPGR